MCNPFFDVWRLFWNYSLVFLLPIIPKLFPEKFPQAYQSCCRLLAHDRQISKPSLKSELQLSFEVAKKLVLKRETWLKGPFKRASWCAFKRFPTIAVSGHYADSVHHVVGYTWQGGVGCSSGDLSSTWTDINSVAHWSPTTTLRSLPLYSKHHTILTILLNSIGESMGRGRKTCKGNSRTLNVRKHADLRACIAYTARQNINLADYPFNLLMPLILCW